jgi:hypothetical protein
LSFDKLMEQSHKKLVQHMVLMQTGFSTPLMWQDGGQLGCFEK